MLGRLIGATGNANGRVSAALSRVPARREETLAPKRDDAWHYAETPRAQVIVPHDRQGTTVNIIWGERDRLPDAKPRRMPGHLAFALKAIGTIAFIGAIHWGPSYFSCRQMKDRGLFYYGTTISSCMGEKIDARNAYFEELGRKFLPVL